MRNLRVLMSKKFENVKYNIHLKRSRMRRNPFIIVNEVDKIPSTLDIAGKAQIWYNTNSSIDLPNTVICVVIIFTHTNNPLLCGAGKAIEGKEKRMKILVTKFLADFITASRLNHSWTYEELAAKSGLTPNLVAAMERPRTPTTMEEIKAILQALDIELDKKMLRSILFINEEGKQDAPEEAFEYHEPFSFGAEESEDECEEADLPCLLGCIQDALYSADWPEFLENAYGPIAALDFYLGCKVFNGYIDTMVDELAHEPAGTHASELDDEGFTGLYFPDAFRMGYTYEFFYAMQQTMKSLYDPFDENGSIPNEINSIAAYLCLMAIAHCGAMFLLGMKEKWLAEGEDAVCQDCSASEEATDVLVQVLEVSDVADVIDYTEDILKKSSLYEMNRGNLERLLNFGFSTESLPLEEDPISYIKNTIDSNFADWFKRYESSV